jgi:hypothetical protein
VRANHTRSCELNRSELFRLATSPAAAGGRADSEANEEEAVQVAIDGKRAETPESRGRANLYVEIERYIRKRR